MTHLEVTQDGSDYVIRISGGLAAPLVALLSSAINEAILATAAPVAVRASGSAASTMSARHPSTPARGPAHAEQLDAFSTDGEALEFARELLSFSVSRYGTGRRATMPHCIAITLLHLVARGRAGLASTVVHAAVMHPQVSERFQTFFVSIEDGDTTPWPKRLEALLEHGQLNMLGDAAANRIAVANSKSSFVKEFQHHLERKLRQAGPADERVKFKRLSESLSALASGRPRADAAPDVNPTHSPTHVHVGAHRLSRLQIWGVAVAAATLGPWDMTPPADDVAPTAARSNRGSASKPWGSGLPRLSDHGAVAKGHSLLRTGTLAHEAWPPASAAGADRAHVSEHSSDAVTNTRAALDPRWQEVSEVDFSFAKDKRVPLGPEGTLHLGADGLIRIGEHYSGRIQDEQIVLRGVEPLEQREIVLTGEIVDAAPHEPSIKFYAWEIKGRKAVARGYVALCRKAQVCPYDEDEGVWTVAEQEPPQALVDRVCTVGSPCEDLTFVRFPTVRVEKTKKSGKISEYSFDYRRPGHRK